MRADYYNRGKEGIYNRVKKQILTEQKALRDAFESQSDFLNFFLESDDIEDNLFYRHDKLATQAKEFCFYQKHTFEKTDIFQRDKNIIYNYFLDFLEAKVQNNPEVLPKLQRHLDSWMSFLQTQFISHDERQHKQDIILTRFDLMANVSNDLVVCGTSDKIDFVRYTTPQPQCHSDETEELPSYFEPIVLSRQPAVQKLSAFMLKTSKFS